MQKKLLLIDGNDLLDHSYKISLLGINDQNTEEYWAFTTYLQKILKKIDPTHVLIFLKNVSSDNFSKYFEILKELKIPVLKIPETSNINSYLKKYSFFYKEKSEVILSSFDYNLIQLIDDHISLLACRGSSQILYSKEKVYKKWKVEPQYFADYLSLVGDPTKNIVGIPRIGPKMAASLIEEFKNIENILANRGIIKQDNIRLTLELFEYDLLNNFKLCQIIEADETPISLKNLLYQKDQRSTKEILITMGILKSE